MKQLGITWFVKESVWNSLRQ